MPRSKTYERIKVAMRSYRATLAARQDTRFIEMDTAFYIGWLGHYTGDGAMPLHTSVHHDGWQGDNPNGYTREPRVHGRFESQFVDLIALQESDILARIPAARHLADPFDAILEHLDRSHTRVERVYQLDQAKAFDDAANAPGRELVYTCTGEAAALLRDLVYTAWLDSAAAPNGTGTVQPISPTHPQYNPATGSAPAGRPGSRCALKKKPQSSPTSQESKSFSLRSLRSPRFLLGRSSRARRRREIALPRAGGEA